jgi:hypothetical protein
MNLFHKVYAFRIPFSTCIFTIIAVSNGCADAAYNVSLCPRVMAFEMSVILRTWSDSFALPSACSVPINSHYTAHD